MKSLSELLNKKFRKKLDKQPRYKEKMKKMQNTFKEYGISCNVKDEFSFYQVEIIYEGILNKKAFEETYLATYVSMHDYWADLDYQERRHQMNVDIDRMRKELKSFPYDGEEIYIPMFDQRMNRIYRQEIVMLELKQYGKFIKKFDDLIQDNLYGNLPYVYNFTSCIYVCGDAKNFSIYNPDLNRIYFIQDFQCISFLSFDPNRSGDSSFEEVHKIAQSYMNKNYLLATQSIIESALVSDRLKRRLQRYYKKLAKDQA